MSVPQELPELVERFNTNREAYRSGQYNETQLRREFIDPFFQLLGWDVNNEKGYAEAYKDVIHEDSIKIGGITKAPDYCFRIGGVRKFFVETKRPSVNIKDDIDPAFQLRRYAWSAKLPLSILTDFEEFAVYDCRVKPNKTDKASTARIMYVGNWGEFTQHWDEIASIFSREAVLKGSFDRYAESSKAKKGTAEVDTAFLKEIESWRDALARSLALRNPELSQRDLNFAVQRTIDRIIFLRICEDRGIEHYGKLMALQNGDRVYARLCEMFHRADERYNSGLFHFQKEKGRAESPDTLTLNLAIDDSILKSIIKNLYYPDSPYEFSVLSADILGQVYEQFLGKVIRLTAGHRAVIEEKPEVRKAGGVYYTPTYIVDYIVKNTVGKLVGAENFQSLRKTIPKEISKIRILDPACGSGSFLLGAYQYLLDWHRDWYIANEPEKWATGRSPALYQAQTTLLSVGGQGGAWRLTTAERRRILLNNIYGVDIDPQAVEVTKLSLLLKVLEGESEQTIVKQLKLFHERALPDLGNNIKCGNSLIGPDFYEGRQMSLFDDEERYRINVFDWEIEFPEIMKAGGFDVVIGNPPYIPIEMMSESQKAYFQQKHHQLERKYDSSIVFILALLQKLKPSGRLGFISSIAWQTGENFAKLREHLFTKVGILNLINLPFDVFKDAYVDTGIYILSGKPVNTYSIYRFPKKEKFPDINNVVFTEVPIRLISPPDFKVILEPRSQKILSRILEDKRFVQLGSFTISTQGLAGNRFEKNEKPKGDDWYPFLEKGQARRYVFDIEHTVYTDLSNKVSLKPFYEKKPKLLIRRVINRQDRLMVAYTDQRLVFKKDINPFVITDAKWNIFFVLGILNSRLISYLYINSSTIATKDDFRQTTLAELRRTPIPYLTDEDVRQNRMVVLVNQMLELHKQLASAKTDHDKTVIQRQIDAADRQIDQLVYELYGLTEEEIKIVEEGST